MKRLRLWLRLLQHALLWWHSMQGIWWYARMRHAEVIHSHHEHACKELRHKLWPPKPMTDEEREELFRDVRRVR